MSILAACELEEISESEMVSAVLGDLLNEVRWTFTNIGQFQGLLSPFEPPS
jgi:hypothetical protein